MSTTSQQTTAEHPALALPARPITAPVARTSGKGIAPTIMRRYTVAWELDTANGVTTADGQTAGRVIESIPGKLYYFQDRRDSEHGHMWGMFPTADKAAEAGAVRYTLNKVRGY